MMAKDGKPYDIVDYRLKQRPDEIQVIQLLRPSRARRMMLAPVGEEYVKKAENMIISAEELRTGEIAIWVKAIGDLDTNELCGIAKNGPGDNDPTTVLRRLIDKKLAEIS